MIYTFDQLPKEVGDLANRFLNIQIGEITFPCPYYIRSAKKFAHPSLSGKGTPQQIEDLVQSTAYAYNYDLKAASAHDIRKFMMEHEIGIDCSGLVVQLLDKWTKVKYKNNIVNYIKLPSNPIRKLIFKMRYISNISAERITNLENCDDIKLIDVKPGDLVRAKGIPKGDHVLMITNVEKENGIPKELQYIQSISQYGDENGVRIGKIIIHDINKAFEDQEWIDNDSEGKNLTLAEYKWKIEDNGIRRLKKLQLDK